MGNRASRDSWIIVCEWALSWSHARKAARELSNFRASTATGVNLKFRCLADLLTLGYLRDWYGLGSLSGVSSSNIISIPAQSYGAKYVPVVGVDIDGLSIQGAWRRRRILWCCQQPSLIHFPALQESCLLAEEQPTVTNYFPASCECEFGSLPTVGKQGDRNIISRSALQIG